MVDLNVNKASTTRSCGSNK